MTSPRTERMLGTLPYYYAEEPFLFALLDGAATELDRFEGNVDAVRDGLLPGMATDVFGMLGLWELILGLPVEPAGASLLERQAAVAAALRLLDASSGEDWYAAMQAAIVSSWAHFENDPGDGQLLIEIPYDPGSWRTGQIEEIARKITPAHLAIVMRYSEGFLLDVSLLDQDAL